MRGTSPRSKVVRIFASVRVSRTARGSGRSCHLCTRHRPSSCAGCSNSEVLIFELKSNGAAELRRTLHGHDAPVTALAASNKHLVSADESGDVRVWDAENSYAQSSAFASTGCVFGHCFGLARARACVARRAVTRILRARYPCTSVGIREDVVAAGYSTGHLRIFRTRTSELVVEVAAHSRCINAIDVAAHQPLVRLARPRRLARSVVIAAIRARRWCRRARTHM